MTLHFFAIPALTPQPAQDAFNRFCQTHCVVSIERQFVGNGVNAYWALCVTIADADTTLPDALKAPDSRNKVTAGSARIDYKTILNEQDFALFAVLRNWRKSTAESEGVPIYAVFTNEQLAEIVRRRVDSLTSLGGIEGVGPARVQRYGAPLLSCFKTALAEVCAEHKNAT